MNINRLIVDTLKPISEIDKIPVSFLIGNGKSDTYITFSIYLELEGEYQDNISKTKDYYIQIDIFSKKNYTNLVDKVINLMKNAGFTFKSCEGDLYESDTKYYHKPIRFIYTEIF